MPTQTKSSGSSNPFASGGVTNNNIPKSNGAGALADSSITDNGTNVSTTEVILAPDGGYAFSADTAMKMARSSNTMLLGKSDVAISTSAHYITARSDGSFAFSANTNPDSTGDTVLTRDAAGALALKQSATTDALFRTYGANAGFWEHYSATELLTLSTGGTTTDTAANLLPAGSIIHAVCCRVTTTITTATNWSVGDPTTAARFSAANATLVSGTTSVGLDHMSGAVTTLAAGPSQNAAAKVRITTTGTPGAGVIRITVFASRFVAPTS